MTWTRASRFVLASLVIHAAGALVLFTVPHPPHREIPRTIDVEIRHERPAASPAPSASAPAPARPSPAPAPSRSLRRQPLPPPPAHPAEPARSAARPEPAAPTPGTPAPVRPDERRRPIDLFNSNAIEVAVQPERSAAAIPAGRSAWGGVTRRAGDGQGGDPNARDAASDREEAAARLHDLLGAAQSGERLKSGNVAPRWRKAERAAQAQFHPSVATVSDDGAASGFLHQWMNSQPTGGTSQRGVDESREGGFLGMGGAGAGAKVEMGQTGRTHAEVEVVMAADGTLISARLVARSGRRRFDEEALALVRRACASGGPLDEKSVVVTRWAVEAWLNVAPPMPMAGFGFDESTGKISGTYPLKKGVQTSVRLISIVAKR